MRSILHPGAVARQRVQALPTATRQVQLELAPGATLLAALSLALAPHGACGAVLRLTGGGLLPLAYVMPALSTSPEHAVYFSQRFQAPGRCRLDRAAVTYGLRDGQPWLHCHALWSEPDGTPRAGHVLADQSVIEQPVSATAWLLDGAQFQVQPDAETHFSLFQPVRCDAQPMTVSGTPGMLVRLAPNTDVCTALEGLCRDHGIRSASLAGGVGSLVGAVFDDGREVVPFVTEVLIRSGRISCDATGAHRAEIDVSLVDFTGAIAHGCLARGANPVLVTFELVLIPD